VEGAAGATGSDAARKRVAVEMVAKHGRTLRRTASRFSICAEDAEDAFQRALEILLTKAPPGDAGELIRWMQTVTKHEALAIRRSRERQLGSPRPPAGSEEGTVDWVSLIPASSHGPAERAERREDMARSREALGTLKPAELRALTLLAEGYSYAEIGELTGYSRTKVNRCLAEGRERFRAFLARSESGGRCAELRPLLSAFCDGEAGPDDGAVLREHLRACAQCRATMRAYRAAPRALAALAPVPLASRSLIERAHDALLALQSRLPGQGGDAEAATAQVAASGGARGAGMAGLTKLLAICAGTAGGAAACVGAGVVPTPLNLTSDPPPPRTVRVAPVSAPEGTAATNPSPAPAGIEAAPDAAGGDKQSPTTVEAAPEPVEDGAVEYTPPSASAPPPEPVGAASSSPGSAAGEFGP
jgi:RNA polymerase sigma factor (sigma-70 family)